MANASSSVQITLYGPAITPYTEKVVRALRLKRLAFELVEPRRPEDYRRFSPETGLLPVIEIGGERTADSTAILDRLDARFPEPPLLASEPKVAQEQRRLEEWVSETFFFYLHRWLNARVGPQPDPPAGTTPSGPLGRLGLIGPDGAIRDTLFDTRDGGPGEEFERRIDDLDKLLGGRPFFFGHRISRADLAAFAFLNGLYRNRYPGGRALLERWPALLAHTERVDRATAGSSPNYS